MARKLPKKEAEQQLPKNRYWQNELDSLGIESKEKKEFNDKEEKSLQTLSNRQ